jgi:hypothetical protein
MPSLLLRGDTGLLSTFPFTSLSNWGIHTYIHNKQ